VRHPPYLLCLEGGGSRCQAALLNAVGEVLGAGLAGDINTNFVAPEAAQAAALTAVREALAAAGVPGNRVTHFASALVAPRFGADLFGDLLPNAQFHTYAERDVVFARAGCYEPHGVAVVAATGASVWGVRADDGRVTSAGGWGSLLGDEGSAYAVGLGLLRAAARLYEGRLAPPTPSRIVSALCEHFDLDYETFRAGLCDVAYRRPLTRPDIARLAPLGTRLAAEGDPVARQIVRKVASDLANLALFVAHRLFAPDEVFGVAAAGGLFNAGALVLDPLRARFVQDFPKATLRLGREEPAVALGRLLIHDHLS
jgi:N-acetylglucosamine kinase-like BadF-type ATPase